MGNQKPLRYQVLFGGTLENTEYRFGNLDKLRGGQQESICHIQKGKLQHIERMTHASIAAGTVLYYL